ncbi:MAG TPA: orotidine-5'-phosphate decarboxylase [Gemmatimonadaceae bacterium]
MTKTDGARRVNTTPIVALDVPTASAAMTLVSELGDACRFYKVGNELFTAAGPSVVAAIREQGREVFLDLKFHDIPNTVTGGVRNAAKLGASLVTVHASGGMSMLRAAADAARDAGGDCRVLAVTVLTSLSAEDVSEAWGRGAGLDVEAEVLRLADAAAEAGVQGVVCGGGEARAVSERFGDRLSILVPGVRADGGASQDQARIVTPREAAAAGARYVVVGRIVTGAPDRRQAMRTVSLELSS